jgi:hypothetical protein
MASKVCSSPARTRLASNRHRSPSRRSGSKMIFPSRRSRGAGASCARDAARRRSTSCRIGAGSTRAGWGDDSGSLALRVSSRRKRCCIATTTRKSRPFGVASVRCTKRRSKRNPCVIPPFKPYAGSSLLPAFFVHSASQGASHIARSMQHPHSLTSTRASSVLSQ